MALHFGMKTLHLSFALSDADNKSIYKFGLNTKNCIGIDKIDNLTLKMCFFQVVIIRVKTRSKRSINA